MNQNLRAHDQQLLADHPTLDHPALASRLLRSLFITLHGKGFVTLAEIDH